MYRTIKINGHFALITYGKPDERLSFFNSTLEKFPFELKWEKVSLSLVSNFINILKNTSGNFSVTQSLKDKNLLAMSMLELSITRLISQKEEIYDEDQKNIHQEKINKKIAELKLFRLYYSIKKNKKNEEELKDNKEKNENHICENQTKEISYKNFCKNEKIENSENNLCENDTIERENFQKNIELRRSHCYLYIFKKLSNHN